MYVFGVMAGVALLLLMELTHALVGSVAAWQLASVQGFAFAILSSLSIWLLITACPCFSLLPLSIELKECSVSCSSGEVVSSLQCLGPSWGLDAFPQHCTVPLRRLLYLQSSYLLLSTRPSFWHMFRRLIRLASWSLWLWMPMTPGHYSKITSIYNWNTSWLLILAPEGIWRNLSQPWCVLSAGLSLGAMDLSGGL